MEVNILLKLTHQEAKSNMATILFPVDTSWKTSATTGSCGMKILHRVTSQRITMTMLVTISSSVHLALALTPASSITLLSIHGKINTTLARTTSMAKF